MKKLIKEELKINKFKHDNVDPFEEEDWNEYEIKNGDKFYIFGIGDNDVFAGTATATDINNNAYYIKIDKCTNNEDIINKKIRLSSDIIKNINDDQLTKNNVKVNDNIIINTIVTQRKFAEYFKEIHGHVRKEFYNKVKLLQKELNSLNDEMDKKEELVISLKRNLKSKDEFPSPSDITLDDKQYIVIKVNTSSITNIKVDVMITKLDDNNDDKGGKNLIDIETGNKAVYLLKNADKLIKNKYLLLKSKRDEKTQTYITNDIETVYPKFIDKIINDINTKINENIEKYREGFKNDINKIKEKRDKIEILREKYLEFSFSDLVSKLKEL